MRCKGSVKSFIVLLKDWAYFVRWRTNKKIAILTLTAMLALTLTLILTQT